MFLITVSKINIIEFYIKENAQSILDFHINSNWLWTVMNNLNKFEDENLSSRTLVVGIKLSLTVHKNGIYFDSIWFEDFS